MRSSHSKWIFVLAAAAVIASAPARAQENPPRENATDSATANSATASTRGEDSQSAIGANVGDAVSQQARDASTRAEQNAATTATPNVAPPIGAPPIGVPSGANGATNNANASGANVSAEVAAAPELTLSQAIEIALRQNPRRRAALASLQAAAARIGTAKSAGKIQVGVQGNINGTRTFGRETATAGGTGGGTGSGGTGGGTGGSTGDDSSGGSSSTRRIFGLDTNETINLAAQLPIYTGGRVSASTRVARFNAQAQALQVLQVEQTLVLDTTNSYLSVLRGDQLVQVSQSNEAVSQERLRVAQVRFDAGAAARLEVLRAETDLANARQVRLSAINNAGQARANFNTLLAQPSETPVRLQPITRLNLPSALVVSGIAAANPAAAQGAAPLSPAPNIAAGNAGTPESGVAGTGSSAATTGATGIAANNNAASGTNTTPGATTGIGTSGIGTNGIGTSGIGTNSGTQAANTSGTATTTPGASTTFSSGATGTASQLSVQSGSAAPLSVLQTAAGASNSSLAVSEANLRAAEAAVDLARAQRRPSIGLNLGSLLRDPAGFVGRLALSVGLGISQGLVDSGRSRSQIDEARAIVVQARENIIGQRLGIDNQIEQSLLNLDSAQRRQESADVAVVSAQEAVRAAQLGYEAGVRTSIEVSDAQAALLQTQTDAVNARFDVAGAQAQLAGAVGVLTQEAQAGYTGALGTTPEQELSRINAELQAQPEKKKRRKFLGIF